MMAVLGILVAILVLVALAKLPNPWGLIVAIIIVGGVVLVDRSLPEDSEGTPCCGVY